MDRKLTDVLGICHDAWRDLLTWLNVLATAVMGYAVLNPDVMAQAVRYLPDPLQPYAPALLGGWFLLVQYAKARDEYRRTQREPRP